ncbi:killer cell lectin-like receptor subfamily B member 1B allele C isoform X2 [Carettochelys insculpta]|uniref:killer cell lectin-like receptor subfamily B member 1B allele C isoform X2 n=1 Tax=Carettochelys insculpta TaxID=44489 RepID=UPI003EC0D882
MADERDCLYENVPVGSLPGGKSCGQARRPRPRPRRGAAPGKNPTGAGEPQAPVSPSSASAVPPSPTTLILAARPPCPPWHRTALRAGWAGNVVLLGAVILLVVLEVYLPLSQTRPPPAAPQTGRRSGSCESHQKTAACWEDFRACLKEHLCEEENGSAESSGCKLCPRYWVPHRDKCYWLAKDIKSWNRSHEDCAWRRSQLLVIQDLEEMAFVQNITQDQNQVWIGLNVTSPGRKWTWVDGSLLNQTLLKVLGPADERSCATVKKNELHSEICNTDFRWICQKAAVLI